MKIQDFKTKFAKLEASDQLQTIAELEKAQKQGTYLQDIPLRYKASVSVQFSKLINWCKDTHKYLPQSK